MKSPWQIGLLALAVTGVSAYDFLYFKNYRSPSRPATQISEAQPAAALAEPVLPPSIPAAGSQNAEERDGTGALPHISMEEIHRLAQQAFVAKEWGDAESKTAWPRRDPFEAYEEPVRISRSVPVKAQITEAPPPAPLPAPKCIFSGTLIEQDKRLALVDGVPLSVGDRLGSWQLSRIEPDYIILEAGKVTHRVELQGMGLQVARRENP